MGYDLTGESWTTDEFLEYVSNLDLTWANSVTIHHTYNPDLKARPRGWQPSHLKNLRYYYQNILGWSAGPHLFTDENKVFGLCSLEKKGVHAVSFNHDSIAIEMLGNYDEESPTSGRGLDVVRLTAKTVAILLEKIDTKATSETVKFHRDDPRTYKTCPGNLLEKEWFLSLVKNEMGGQVNLTLEQRVSRIENKLGI